MTVQINEFELTPAPAPAATTSSAAASESTVVEPTLSVIAQAQRLELACREKALRLFAH